MDRQVQRNVGLVVVVGRSLLAGLVRAGFPAPIATKKMHVLMHVQNLDSTGRAGAP